MSDIDPYQTPPSALDESSANVPPAVTNLASRGVRLGAAIIDGVLATLVTLPLLFGTSYFSGIASGEAAIVPLLVLTVIGIVVYLLMHGHLLSKNGQTIGKKLVGIKIVDHDTDALVPLGRIVSKRLAPIWLATLIPVVGNFLVLADSLSIFRGDRRCIHDLIAGTKVIYA